MASNRHGKRFLTRKGTRIALSVLAGLVALRVALPFVVERYVNDTLNGLDGYTGKIADVDLNLWLA